MPEHPSPAFDLLVCPLCGQDLAARDRALRCPGGHTFDLARQGYVNLLPGDARPGTADTADMVAARHAFLAAGSYAPLTRAVAEAAAEHAGGAAAVLDAGAGTGHYLAAVLDALPGAVGLALDLSKFALRRAARSHQRAAAAVWDVWQPLPVRSGSVDVLLDVFAPRNAAEFHRVLRPGGLLLVVTPGPGHLAELREAAGLLAVDADKEERLERTLGGFFRAGRTVPLDHPMSLDPARAAAAVAMGPSAHHAARLPAVDGSGEPVRVTASFRLSFHRPLPAPPAGPRR